MPDRWKAIAALIDQSRRALYEYVRRQDHPVSREEAAAAGRLSRGLAAFHLDKLVDAGLLRARYESPPGQVRGRGRTPKVYEPASDGLAVMVPERRYELIAEILVDAVAADPTNAHEAALALAFQRGHALGAALHEGAGPHEVNREGGGPDLPAVLAGLGFEPQRAEAGRVLLVNCPFRALAVRQTALVCGLNHAFLTGLVDGLGVSDVEARLVPRPGACCVEVAATVNSGR